MTCEVMLMNMEGVALAADSAVTITNFDEQGRVAGVLNQTQVEKIFVLDPAGPVAAMIYGDARFGDYPWKTVLTALHETPGGASLGPLETARRLVDFLAASDDAGSGPLKVTEDAERAALWAYVDGFVDHFRDQFEGRISGAGAGVRSVDAVFEEAIEALTQEIAYEPPLAPDRPAAKRRRIGEPGPRMHGFLLRHLDRALDDALKAAFPGGGIGSELRGRLRDLAVTSVLLHWLPPAPWGTGIVIAGYGPQDTAPRYAHLRVAGAFGGVLQHLWEDWGGPVAGVRPVVFQSFAQDDLIGAFALGAQKGFIAYAAQALAGALDEVFDAIDREFGKTSADRRTLGVLRATARYYVPHKGLGVAAQAFGDFTGRTLGALLDTASADGLAEHAGKLVQLAVLDHELTGSGAVAKPISVLRMSRGAHRLDR